MGICIGAGTGARHSERDSVKGAPKDSIDINLLFNYDLQLVVDPIKTKSYTKGDKVDLAAKLENGGQPLQDNDLYKDMKATLVVKDVDTGKESVPRCQTASAGCYRCSCTWT